jgi:hypothetical protein
VNEKDGSGARPGGRSSGRKSLVILTLVLLTLIGCAGALTELWNVDAVTGAVAPDTLPAVPYFPSQYVNQATENSEHIQAF